MFPYGGAVIPEHMSKPARVQTYMSAVIDISASTPLAAKTPILFDPDHQIIILDVYLVYQAAGGTAGGTLTVGTPSDTDAIVESYTTSTTNAAGDTAVMTLATTLTRPGPQLYGGKPVVPKNTPVVAAVAQGASGTGDFSLCVFYTKVSPGR